MKIFLRKSISIYAFLTGTLLLCQGHVFAQNTDKPLQTDTTKNKSALSSLKPYKDVVPGGTFSQNSFFKVHQVKERYLLEIPDSLLSRDILTVTRIEKGSTDYVIPLINIGYSGDELGRTVITFDRIPGDKLAMRSIKFTQLANDTTANGLARSIDNNNMQAIEAVFPIKALNSAASSSVIDVTDFFNGKGMTATLLARLPLDIELFNGLSPERSYINKVRGFPINIEISTVKTNVYKTTATTMELNTSLILLPKVPMKPRLKDPRVGFFSNSYVDFDKNATGVAATKYIKRWRMEPKDADSEKYKRGELVEPKKPIIIYIDPATPKKWVPYLIAGINDWSAAFEKAGFKNAIIGKEAPLNDTTWSMYDARHSMVIYKPSSIANASGPNVNDPRSGEILETHINWYHSVMTLIRDWYIVQAAAIDPRARKPELDDELMGQLIRFVSSHEVGHTLGLEHNFGSSSTVPVENLRNKAWVEANGHTPSIMDYARFNYVAQPEDNIGAKGIYPRIGEYDKWAIEWGYKWMPEFKSAEAERPYLNKWIVSKLASGKQYFYGSQVDPITDEFPMNTTDPRDQSEDLGDDAMLASSYGIKNLKRIMPNLIAWTKEPNKDYDRAVELYDKVVGQFGRYMGHVQRNIGGVYATPVTVEQHQAQYQVEEKAKQKRAMAFLQQQLFSTPTWLMDKNLFLSSKAGFSSVTAIQQRILSSLLDKELIARLISNETSFSGKGYPATEMLEDLKKGIFSELSSKKAISIYRGELQNSYVESLIKLIGPNPAASNLNSVLKAHAKTLLTTIKKAVPQFHDQLSHQHLEDLYERLKFALERKNETGTALSGRR